MKWRPETVLIDEELIVCNCAHCGRLLLGRASPVLEQGVLSRAAAHDELGRGYCDQCRTWANGGIPNRCHRCGEKLCDDDKCRRKRTTRRGHGLGDENPWQENAVRDLEEAAAVMDPA